MDRTGVVHWAVGRLGLDVSLARTVWHSPVLAVDRSAKWVGLIAAVAGYLCEPVAFVTLLAIGCGLAGACL